MGTGLRSATETVCQGRWLERMGDDSYSPESEMKEQSWFFFLEEPVKSFTADLERTAHCKSWLQL